MFNTFLSSLNIHDLAVIKVCLEILQSDGRYEYQDFDNRGDSSYHPAVDSFLDSIINYDIQKKTANHTENIDDETFLIYSKVYDQLYDELIKEGLLDDTI